MGLIDALLDNSEASLGVGIALVTTCPIALGLFVIGAVMWRRGSRSRNWPATTGTVTASSIASKMDHEGNTSYVPAITYEFTVGGRQYQGDQLKFGGVFGSGSQTPALRRAAQYPVGEQVSVYYNPDKPEEAVLEQGANAVGCVLMGGGVVIVLIGLGIAAFAAGVAQFGF